MWVRPLVFCFFASNLTVPGAWIGGPDAAPTAAASVMADADTGDVNKE